jgi:hypothetical protein
MNKEKPPVLWTGTFDYYATGEGRTIGGWIGYAHDEAECRRKCGEVLDPYFSAGASCAVGVVRDKVATLLWSDQALDIVEQAEGRGNVWLSAVLHFNFA